MAWKYEPGSNRMLRPTGDPFTRAAAAAAEGSVAMEPSSSGLEGMGPAGLWAQRGPAMKVPSSLIVGMGKTTPDANPLADVPNWFTGGRQTSPAAAMAGDTMQINWMYIAGAAAVAFLLFRRK